MVLTGVPGLRPVISSESHNSLHPNKQHLKVMFDLAGYMISGSPIAESNLLQRMARAHLRDRFLLPESFLANPFPYVKQSRVLQIKTQKDPIRRGLCMAKARGLRMPACSCEACQILPGPLFLHAASAVGPRVTASVRCMLRLFSHKPVDDH